MDFPPMCLYSYLTYYNLKNFFVYVSFHFQTTFTAKSKSLKKKIIQINVISLITLRTHKNYEKKALYCTFCSQRLQKKAKRVENVAMITF